MGRRTKYRSDRNFYIGFVTLTNNHYIVLRKKELKSNFQSGGRTKEINYDL